MNQRYASFLNSILFKTVTRGCCEGFSGGLHGSKGFRIIERVPNQCFLDPLIFKIFAAFPGILMVMIHPSRKFRMS